MTSTVEVTGFSVFRPSLWVGGWGVVGGGVGRWTVGGVRKVHKPPSTESVDKSILVYGSSISGGLYSTTTWSSVYSNVPQFFVSVQSIVLGRCRGSTVRTVGDDPEKF